MSGDTYSPRALRALLAGSALFATLASCSFASSPAPATREAGLLGTKGRLEKGFTVLYSFQGSPDGATPFAGVVVDKAGNIFGTTFVDGEYNAGTVFELSPAGSSYAETIVHSFASADGDGPVDAPLEDASGNLYVTTLQGGEYGAGTAVALSPAGGAYAESGVFAFGDGSEGSAPNAGFLERGTTLYATTSSGGKYGAGAIVALSSSGLTYSDVHDFGNGTVAFARVEYQYVSSVFFDPTDVSISERPAINLVGASIGYEPANSHWTVALWGKNLTDQQYITGFGTGTPLTAPVGDPRTFGVRVEYKY